MKWFCYGVSIFLINVLTVNDFFVSAFIIKRPLMNPFLYSKVIVKCNNSHEENVDVSNILVYYYAHIYKDVCLIGSAADVFTHNFPMNMSKKLLFFVPGYASNINQNASKVVWGTFRNDHNTNLMIVDHSYYTNGDGGLIESYQRSVFYTYHIGKALGKFLVRLHELGYASNNIHAIGHSLGSHMLSYAGTVYTEATNENIWRITGIDPAGPCFANCAEEKQIRRGVAEYVEVYHCNAGELGTYRVLADIDFFLNYGGWHQPNCSDLWFGEKAECSHSNCVNYWMDTVSRPKWLRYKALACGSYGDYKAGRCAGNEVTIAGYHNPGNATGVFFVTT